MKKIASRWVLHDLTATDQKARVQLCKGNLAKLKENKWRSSNIVTGDDPNHRHITVRVHKIWVYQGEKPRTVVRRGRFGPKTIFSVFFKRSDVVHLCYLESGKTINHEKYIDDCLKSIVKVLKKERPVTGAKNIKFHHDNARPHVHKSVKEYLLEEKFFIMGHLSY